MMITLRFDILSSIHFCILLVFGPTPPGLPTGTVLRGMHTEPLSSHHRTEGQGWQVPCGISSYADEVQVVGQTGRPPYLDAEKPWGRSEVRT